MNYSNSNYSNKNNIVKRQKTQKGRAGTIPLRESRIEFSNREILKCLYEV